MRLDAFPIEDGEGGFMGLVSFGPFPESRLAEDAANTMQDVLKEKAQEIVDKIAPGSVCREPPSEVQNLFLSIRNTANQALVMPTDDAMAALKSIRDLAQKNLSRFGS